MTTCSWLSNSHFIGLDSELWHHISYLMSNLFPKSSWETWQRGGCRHAPKPGRLWRPERTLSRWVQHASQRFVCLSHVGNMKGCSRLRRSFLQTYLSFIMRPRAAGLQLRFTQSPILLLWASPHVHIYFWQQIWRISQAWDQMSVSSARETHVSVLWP